MTRPLMVPVACAAAPTADTSNSDTTIRIRGRIVRAATAISTPPDDVLHVKKTTGAPAVRAKTLAPFPTVVNSELCRSVGRGRSSGLRLLQSEPFGGREEIHRFA